MADNGAPARATPQRQQKARNVLVALVVSLVKALLLGWLILSGMFFFRWWQGSYVAAMSDGNGWLASQTDELRHLLGAEEIGIQNRMLSGMTQFSHLVDGQMWQSVETRFDEGEKAEAALLGEMPTVLSANKQRPFDGITQGLASVWQGCLEASHLIGVAGMVMLLKLALLLLSLPLFLLASLVGFSDGLMLRTIRTASLGRESAYVFHKLVSLFPRLVGIGILVFLLMPVSTGSPYVLLMLALGVGLWFSQTTSRFKKYL